MEGSFSVALLESIHGPSDEQRLDPAQLADLAAEVREFLITSVSRRSVFRM